MFGYEWKILRVRLSGGWKISLILVILVWSLSMSIDSIKMLIFMVMVDLKIVMWYSFWGFRGV